MKKDTRTLGQKIADKVTVIGASWAFVVGFCATLGAWILLNTLHLGIEHFDEYPFIFLNLILSCLAAIQAPIIMMSQKRQNAIDREILQRSVRLDEYIRRELNRLSQFVRSESEDGEGNGEAPPARTSSRQSRGLKPSHPRHTRQVSKKRGK